jgi:hypothetical protein
MYGPTPSIIIERFDKPPPENMFNIPKNWLFERNLFNATVSIPGIGIAERNLKSIKEKSTKSILFLRDFSVKANFILFKKFSIVVLVI